MTGTEDNLKARDADGQIIEIAIADIMIDPGILSRDKVITHVVKEYAKAIKDGSMSPHAVVVDDGEHKRLVAGWHQIEACRSLGLTTIHATIIRGTKRDAILYSIKSNASHGRKLTNADKRRCVKNMLADEELRKWAVNEIVRLCGVSWGTVRAVWNEVQAELCLLKFEDREDVKFDRGGKIHNQSAKRKPAAPGQVAEGLKAAGAELHRVFAEAAAASDKIEEALEDTPAARTCLDEIAAKVAAAKAVLGKAQALLRRASLTDAEAGTPDKTETGNGDKPAPAAAPATADDGGEKAAEVQPAAA